MNDFKVLSILTNIVLYYQTKSKYGFFYLIIFKCKLFKQIKKGQLNKLAALRLIYAYFIVK